MYPSSRCSRLTQSQTQSYTTLQPLNTYHTSSMKGRRWGTTKDSKARPVEADAVDAVGRRLAGSLCSRSCLRTESTDVHSSAHDLRRRCPVLLPLSIPKKLLAALSSDSCSGLAAGARIPRYSFSKWSTTTPTNEATPSFWAARCVDKRSKGQQVLGNNVRCHRN